MENRRGWEGKERSFRVPNHGGGWVGGTQGKLDIKLCRRASQTDPDPVYEKKKKKKKTDRETLLLYYHDHDSSFTLSLIMAGELVKADCNYIGMCNTEDIKLALTKQ